MMVVVTVVSGTKPVAVLGEVETAAGVVIGVPIATGELGMTDELKPEPGTVDAPAIGAVVTEAPATGTLVVCPTTGITLDDPEPTTGTDPLPLPEPPVVAGL